METFAIYNLKGGVGKTAGCVNLAYLAAAEGKKTLVWDLDPQGAASFYFRVKRSDRNNESQKILEHDDSLKKSIRNTHFNQLDIIPADISARQAEQYLSGVKHGRKRLKSLLNSVREDYDCVFLDCPSGLSLLHESAFHAAKAVIMPVIPTTLSMRSYEMVKSFIKNNDLEAILCCYFSMADLRKKMHNEILEASFKNKDFLKNYIPYLSDVEKMGIHSAPVMEFANSGYAAQCYRDLWQELSVMISQK